MQKLKAAKPSGGNSLLIEMRTREGCRHLLAVERDFAVARLAAYGGFFALTSPSSDGLVLYSRLERCK